MIIDKSPTLQEYKDTLIKCVQMYMPVSKEELEKLEDEKNELSDTSK